MKLYYVTFLETNCLVFGTQWALESMSAYPHYNYTIISPYTIPKPTGRHLKSELTKVSYSLKSSFTICKKKKN